MKKQPEICYEEFGKEGQTLTGGLPFIHIDEGMMPSVLFIYESRKAEDNDVEREIVMHSYANMLQLKSKLDEDLYDKVREALGLMPLKKASALGEQISDNVKSNLEKAKSMLESKKDD